MKPAPPRTRTLGIAEARVAPAGGAHDALVEDPPAVVDDGGGAERAEQAWQGEPRVAGMSGAPQHAVGARESLLHRARRRAKAGDDLRPDEVVVPAHLDALRPQH